MKFRSLIRKINQLNAVTGLYHKHVIRGGRKSLQPMITHQINLHSADLYQQYLKLMDNYTPGTLNKPECIAVLKTYAFAMQGIVLIGHTVPDSAQILESLQKHIVTN
jgi:hypothetical protein